MLYAVYCIDNPDTAAIRDEHRKVHREYLDKYTDKLFFSGPLQSDDASVSVGSLFILNVRDRSEAEDFAKNETYNNNGVFQKVTITRMRTGRYNPTLAEPI